jgi:hypothetical protein
MQGQEVAVFSLDSLRLQYDPFPIGLASDVFPKEIYRDLVATWPATELFKYKPRLGLKYSLSEINHTPQYHRFLRESAHWREFYRWSKSQAFVSRVIETLAEHSVDLGLRKEQVVIDHEFLGIAARLRAQVRRRVRRFLGHEGVLRSRFEFSMMPANGGCIKPHTDNPDKLITLVLSVAANGEWNPAWGGGTAMLKPKDVSLNFNFVNRQMEFDDCMPIETYPFRSNQCLVFVKTFNSFHAVYPMNGPKSAMRRTLTINIERVVA